MAQTPDINRSRWADNMRAYDSSTTISVLRDVARERARQEGRYGHVNGLHPDGTGPDVAWLAGVDYRPAKEIETAFRSFYEDMDEDGVVPWTLLVREEIAEAFQETDPDRLYDELGQAAALIVSWMERIRPRLEGPRGQ